MQHEQQVDAAKHSRFPMVQVITMLSRQPRVSDGAKDATEWKPGNAANDMKHDDRAHQHSFYFSSSAVSNSSWLRLCCLTHCKGVCQSEQLQG